jgi:Kef-type K+ transport system membrane component KefB
MITRVNRLVVFSIGLMLGAFIFASNPLQGMHQILATSSTGLEKASIKEELYRVKPEEGQKHDILGEQAQVKEDKGTHDHPPLRNLFWIGIILILARMSALLERIRQPVVLGELLIGIVLGNLVLIGVNILEPLRTDMIVRFFAELGVIVLLFQIGLESNVAQMKKVGLRALLVAIVGVVCPFLLGSFVVGPLFLAQESFNTHLFLGAVLTATSVGITARVFKDFNKLKTKEAQIVLGAAVIDDVLGLIILAVVSAIVSTGSISVGSVAWIFFKSVAFLVLAVVLGQRLAPVIGKFFSRIHRGTGMKFTITIGFGLIMAYAASLIGLAPIVGSFAAGLVLDPVHFDDYHEPEAVHEIRLLSKKHQGSVKDALRDIVYHHSHRHVDELIAPLGYFFVPIFFVMTGFSVDVRTFFDPSVLVLAVAVTFVAFLGKLSSGLVAGDASKLIVGLGMIPRGEVGLIFATAGKTLGVVSNQEYAAIVVMVIASTLVTPMLLARLLGKHSPRHETSSYVYDKHARPAAALKSERDLHMAE